MFWFGCRFEERSCVLKVCPVSIFHEFNSANWTWECRIDLLLSVSGLIFQIAFILTEH